MVNPIVNAGAKVAAVAACSGCIENFEKEPIFCGIICGVGGIIGLKVSYESAKLIHKSLIPIFSAVKVETKNLI